MCRESKCSAPSDSSLAREHYPKTSKDKQVLEKNGVCFLNAEKLPNQNRFLSDKEARGKTADMGK